MPETARFAPAMFICGEKGPERPDQPGFQPVCQRPPRHYGEDHHSQYPTDDTGMVVGSAVAWPGPPPRPETTWCEHCRSHFPDDHYDGGGHKVGAAWGPTGYLLACREAIDTIRAYCVGYQTVTPDRTWPAEILALLPDRPAE